MIKDATEIEDSLVVEGAELNSFPKCPSCFAEAPPVYGYGSRHVGLPRSAFHDSEGALKNHQFAQHTTETSRLLSDTKIYTNRPPCSNCCLSHKS